MKFKDLIVDFAGFLLAEFDSKSRAERKRKNPPRFSEAKVLEINKLVSEGDLDFDELLAYSNTGDKVVRDLANCYLNHYFGKNILSIIFNRARDTNGKITERAIEKYLEKLTPELKLKFCGGLKTQNEFLKMMSKNPTAGTWGNGIAGRASITLKIIKMIGKPDKRTLSDSISKRNFIIKTFKTTEYPLHLSYIFNEAIKNEELEFLILELRKKEVLNKKWLSARKTQGDEVINKLIDPKLFNAFNTIYQVKNVTIN